MILLKTKPDSGERREWNWRKQLEVCFGEESVNHYDIQTKKSYYMEDKWWVQMSYKYNGDELGFVC